MKNECLTCKHCGAHKNIKINLKKTDEKDESLELSVRLKNALNSIELNKLIDDPNWQVREEVAKQGYGLNILIDDKNEFVRQAAGKKINNICKELNIECKIQF